MPFLKIVKPSNLHQCKLPIGIHKEGRGGSRYGAGTIWQCPKCEQMWMFVEDGGKISWKKYFWRG